MSTESGHWYDKDGKPCHTQPTKAGAKSATRATNITDARKHKLLPSVSGITGMMANPILDRYRQRRVAEEAFARPPIGHESKDEYVRYLLDKAGEQTRDAADLGTEIHALLEAWGKGTPIDPVHTLTFPSTGERVPATVVIAPVVKLIADLGLQPRGHECVVVNARHGYAGTTDLPWATKDYYGIMDFKSAKTTPGEPIAPRQVYGMQIAAYVAAYWGADADCPIGDKAVGYNLYISTTEPGRVELVSYESTELRAEWEAFQACLTLWRHKNTYDPRTP